MTPQVLQLKQLNFRSEIDGAGDAILRVTEGDETHMPAAIVDYFETEYPGTLRFFTIRRDAVTVEAWWQKNFKKGYSSMPLGRAAGSPGFYLFIKGEPVVWSPGFSGDATVNAAVGIAELFILRSNPAAQQNLQTARDERISKAVNQCFDQYLTEDTKTLLHLKAKAERVRAATIAQAEEKARRWLEAIRQQQQQQQKQKQKQKQKQGKTAAVPESAKPTLADDYALIGSTPFASDAEVRRAYREKAKLNAPDKLAHMDPELQEIATARMAKVNAAWERIKAVRGN